MSNRNIILTGFMGTGKSTIGRQLAKKLGYEFIDTDKVIEARAGKTVTQIFQEDGEEEFRRREAELVQELAERQKLVIATGGGLVMNAQNVAALQRSGRILCLTASPETILSRISRQPGSRPLLKDPYPLQRIRALLAERAATYQQFHQISTMEIGQKELVQKLLALAGSSN